MFSIFARQGLDNCSAQQLLHNCWMVARRLLGACWMGARQCLRHDARVAHASPERCSVIALRRACFRTCAPPSGTPSLRTNMKRSTGGCVRGVCPRGRQWRRAMGAAPCREAYHGIAAIHHASARQQALLIRVALTRQRRSYALLQHVLHDADEEEQLRTDAHAVSLRWNTENNSHQEWSISQARAALRFHVTARGAARGTLFPPVRCYVATNAQVHTKSRSNKKSSNSRVAQGLRIHIKDTRMCKRWHHMALYTVCIKCRVASHAPCKLQ